MIAYHGFKFSWPIRVLHSPMTTVVSGRSIRERYTHRNMITPYA